MNLQCSALILIYNLNTLQTLTSSWSSLTLSWSSSPGNPSTPSAPSCRLLFLLLIRRTRRVRTIKILPVLQNCSILCKLIWFLYWFSVLTHLIWICFVKSINHILHKVILFNFFCLFTAVWTYICTFVSLGKTSSTEIVETGKKGYWLM